jgi:plastocyanin
MFLRIFLFGSAVVGVLVAVLIWAVISGQYEAAQPSPSVNPSASGEVVASSSPTASGETTTVEITNSDFGDDLSVAAGTTVTWMNGDGFAHTATQGSDGVKAPDALFDLQLAAGASDSFTFADAGTYQVTCTLHPNMNMTITVR